MLQALLALLDNGKTYSQADLARILDTTTENIDSWMAYLEKTGHLKRIEASSCSGSCSGCNAHCDAGSKKPSVVFWEKRQ